MIVDAIIPTSPPPFRLEMALASLEKLIGLKPEFLYYSHFGVNSDAKNRLCLYINQLMLWEKIVREGVEKGYDEEEIRNKIIQEDEDLRRIAPYLRSNEILLNAGFNNSVQGFIEYVKKT